MLDRAEPLVVSLSNRERIFSQLPLSRIQIASGTGLRLNYMARVAKLQKQARGV